LRRIGWVGWMFKNIAIIARPDLKESLELAVRIADFLREKGLKPVFEAELASLLGVEGIPLRRMEGDMAVVIGGDGTVLRAVHGLCCRMPLFTVNMGRVGFFGEASPSKAISILQEILEGRFIQDSCFMLTTNLELPNALNEVHIGTEASQQMVDVAVFIDGVLIAHDRVDAILVATSRGSSAYALSAGANVVDPRLDAFVVAPICPLSRNFIPHVVPSDVEVTVKPESPAELIVLIDGQIRKKIGRVGEVKVRKAEESIVFLRTSQNFYERLKRRLRISSVD